MPEPRKPFLLRLQVPAFRYSQTVSAGSLIGIAFSTVTVLVAVGGAAWGLADWKKSNDSKIAEQGVKQAEIIGQVRDVRSMVRDARTDTGIRFGIIDGHLSSIDQTLAQINIRLQGLPVQKAER